MNCDTKTVERPQGPHTCSQISEPNSYDGTSLSGSNIVASDVCLWRCGHDWTHVLYTRCDRLGDPYRGRDNCNTLLKFASFNMAQLSFMHEIGL